MTEDVKIRQRFEKAQALSQSGKKEDQQEAQKLYSESIKMALELSYQYLYYSETPSKAAEWLQDCLKKLNKISDRERNDILKTIESGLRQCFERAAHLKDQQEAQKLYSESIKMALELFYKYLLSHSNQPSKAPKLLRLCLEHLVKVPNGEERVNTLEQITIRLRQCFERAAHLKEQQEAQKLYSESITTEFEYLYHSETPLKAAEWLQDCLKKLNKISDIERNEILKNIESGLRQRFKRAQALSQSEKKEDQQEAQKLYSESIKIALELSCQYLYHSETPSKAAEWLQDCLKKLNEISDIERNEILKNIESGLRQCFERAQTLKKDDKLKAQKLNNITSDVMHELGLYYEQQEKTRTSSETYKISKKALECYEMAANHNHTPSLFTLLFYYKSKKDEKNLDELYQKAVNFNNTEILIYFQQDDKLLAAKSSMASKGEEQKQVKQEPEQKTTEEEKAESSTRTQGHLGNHR